MPSELSHYLLVAWLKEKETDWPATEVIYTPPDESPRQVFDLQQDSSHSILGATFMDKCHLRRESKAVNNQPYLSSPELAKADCRLMLFMQFQHFKDEISALTCRKEVV